MINVDVVCEAEHLPRIKLLQTHMRSLNVELQIHEAVPESCSDRLLIVPRKRNSKLAALDVPDDCERIALFLDEQTDPIEADMQVSLHSWPARSSDRHVETLARHLHISRRTLADGDIKGGNTTKHQTHTAATSDTHRAATKGKRAERRKNVFTLSLLGLGVVALVSLMESDPQKADEQPVSNADQLIQVEQSDKVEVRPVITSESGQEEQPNKPERLLEEHNKTAQNEDKKTSENGHAGDPARARQPTLENTPEIAIIDETGAQISQREAPPGLCTSEDLKDNWPAEPCHLVLF